MSLPFLRSAVLLLGMAFAVRAAPLRILAIGDSMTEEYAYELPFSAPQSKPTNANVRSWPELLRIYRPTEASLGPFEATGGSYADLRNAGHEWNFGIPQMTTNNWFILITTDNPFKLPPSSEDYGIDYYDTRRKLIDELAAVEVVVILLGSNDLKQDYTEIFNNIESENFFRGIKNRLAAIHTFVRDEQPDIPIVVCTVPDVGITPHISNTYTDPAKRITTRAKIAAFNESIISWAAATPHTTVARIDRLTDRLFDEQPFQLNGTVFTLAGNPENPPDRVFCRDNFHVATMGQALIANEIMTAINGELGTNLRPFSNREILQNLLGLNPDRPYLAWISGAGLPGSAMEADPDGDGLPNVVEFALGTPPGSFSRPFTGSFAPGGLLSWHPDPAGLRFASLLPEESTNLATWTPVPAARINTAGDGTMSVTPAAGLKGFVRLQANPKP